MCDSEPARVGELATNRGLFRCGAYLLPELCRSACPCGILVLGGCLMQLLSACQPEAASEEGAPAKVTGASGAFMQSGCARLPGRQSRTVKRSPATKLHHQNSPASTCRLTLRAAVSCCLRSKVPLSYRCLLQRK